MSKINSYKDLLIWQKGIQIAVEVYKITQEFPPEEMFGLTNQLRRASNSISLNIAEGYGRHTTKSYVNYLVNTRSTLNEVESGLILAVELKFIEKNKLISLNNLILEEGKMLGSLINTLLKK